MEKFKLVTQYNEPAGTIPILEDDFDAALAKAKERAKRKCNVVTDIEIYHVIEDRHTTESRLILTIKGKR